MTQYNVPTGEEEEDAIASRALHGNKDHKDFASCKLLRWDLNILISKSQNLVKQIIRGLY
jgi:hypothetical protein